MPSLGSVAAVAWLCVCILSSSLCAAAMGVYGLRWAGDVSVRRAQRARGLSTTTVSDANSKYV